MPSPIWPLQEDHLNEFIEAAQDIGSFLQKSRRPSLPDSLPEWGPEQQLLFKLWIRSLQDVTNISVTSAYEAKKNACDSLWWAFAFPQSIAKPNLLRKESDCSTFLISRRIPTHKSVWEGLDVTPDEFFDFERKDPPDAPYFTFTQCCVNLDIEVSDGRELFLRTVAGNVK